MDIKPEVKERKVLVEDTPATTKKEEEGILLHLYPYLL